MAPMNTPFSSLTPDAILDSLQSIGLNGNGRLLALNSYENRVYQVGMEAGPPLVAKFYRRGRWSNAAILEEHAFVNSLFANEIPAVPALEIAGSTLHEFGDFRFAVFEKRGGRAPELDREDTLEWIGRFLGRIHAVGALDVYKARPSLEVVNFGEAPRDFLLSNGFIPEELTEAYARVAELAITGIQRAFERAGDYSSIRLHGDCHAGNMLWTDDGPHFVDFDDSLMGPAVQDLWLILSGDRSDMTRQLGKVLSGYEDFCDFDMRQLHLVEALRTLRLIHYSAWLAKRWDDPAFPAAFPWFNTQRYWQDRILELKEQISLMDEAPLMHS